MCACLHEFFDHIDFQTKVTKPYIHSPTGLFVALARPARLTSVFLLAHLLPPLILGKLRCILVENDGILE